MLITFTLPLLIFKFLPDYYLIDAGSHQEAPKLIWKGEQILNPGMKDMILIFGLDILSFKFIRIAELQELLIDYYILVHAYYLAKEVKIKK